MRRLAILLLALALAACSPAALASLRSTRPVAKIALIAPFEGLYRQTGYAALDALRLAISEAPGANVDLLPLALDDSADPLHTERAAHKALADPETVAIIGPLTPATTSAAAPILAESSISWYAPLRVDAIGSFGATASDAWAAALITEIAAAARTQGASRLLVILAPGWPDFATLDAAALALPRLIAADAPAALEQYAPGDAVLWLGEAQEAALFLADLRALDANALFWMGPLGGDPVFAARATISTPVYWAIWSDDAYNHESQARPPISPIAYLVYRAAVSAIAKANGEQPNTQPAWRVAFYRLGAAGVSEPWTPQ